MNKIFLPYCNKLFDIQKLVSFIHTLDEDYIIQGHTKCSFNEHPKPKSLDYWLRKNFSKNKDTMQAVSEVIEQIINTGLFEKGKFPCPKTGRLCKGIKLKHQL